VGLNLGRRVGESARLELTGRWSRPEDALVIGLALSSTASAVHSTSHLSRQSDGGVRTFSSAEGSVLWNDATGRVEAYPFRSLGRGGITGRVFRDDDGDSVWDPDEVGVAGVRLQVGGLVISTDENGRYSAWNLTPFEETEVSLDPTSLRDPRLVPRFGSVGTTVIPNGFREIDLPMVIGAEIEGQVVMQAATPRTGDAVVGLPVGGMKILLREVGGTRSLEARSFSDGEFYVFPVPPGEYVLTVDAEDLARRGLTFVQAPPLTVSWGERPQSRLVVVVHRQPEEGNPAR